MTEKKESTEEMLEEAENLIRDLWNAIENGTIDKDFFDLRARVRSITWSQNASERTTR